MRGYGGDPLEWAVLVWSIRWTLYLGSRLGDSAVAQQSKPPGEKIALDWNLPSSWSAHPPPASAMGRFAASEDPLGASSCLSSPRRGQWDRRACIRLLLDLLQECRARRVGNDPEHSAN